MDNLAIGFELKDFNFLRILAKKIKLVLALFALIVLIGTGLRALLLLTATSLLGRFSFILRLA